jgi:hypothetical protein
MSNLALRFPIGGLFLGGITSILTTLMIELSDWTSISSKLGFTVYFSGVPFAFMQYSGIVSAQSNERIILLSGVLLIVATSVIGVWSDKILKQLSAIQCRYFAASFLLLSLANLSLVYLQAVLGIAEIFGSRLFGDGSDPMNWKRAAVLVIQLGITGLFYRYWSKEVLVYKERA